jgi:hypothetical protein
VILGLADCEYYGVDPVGTRVWKRLQSRRTIVEIRDEIPEAFDVESDRYERNLIALLQEMGTRFGSGRAAVSMSTGGDVACVARDGGRASRRERGLVRCGGALGSVRRRNRMSGIGSDSPSAETNARLDGIGPPPARPHLAGMPRRRSSFLPGS